MVLVAQYFSLQPISEAVVIFTLTTTQQHEQNFLLQNMLLQKVYLNLDKAIFFKVEDKELFEACYADTFLVYSFCAT